MRDHQSQTPYVGIDVGTSSVKCIVGILQDDQLGELSVIGYGQSASQGMRKGMIIHPDDVAQSIMHAVNEAERMAGFQVHAATVNVNGNHVQGMNSKGVIAISTANRTIGEDDRSRVEEAATIVQLPANREIVQVFAKNYRIDGQDNIKDPIGMQGVRLEVDTHIVTGASPAIKNLDLALGSIQIIPAHHTLSSLAASEAALNRQQKESGTVLIDIGAGTTNIIVLEEGEVQHIAVLPIGGINITNDLAIGLKVDLEIAEMVKVNHGKLNEEASFAPIELEHEGTIYTFDRALVATIIEARVDELLEYVDKELRKIQRSKKLPGGAVLLGGTSHLPGIVEFTREKLALPARLGRLNRMPGLADGLDALEFATAIGLMQLDFLLGPASQSLASSHNKDKKRGNIKKILHKVKRIAN